MAQIVPPLTIRVLNSGEKADLTEDLPQEWTTPAHLGKVDLFQVLHPVIFDSVSVYLNSSLSSSHFSIFIYLSLSEAYIRDSLSLRHTRHTYVMNLCVDRGRAHMHTFQHTHTHNKDTRTKYNLGLTDHPRKNPRLCGCVFACSCLCIDVYE
jgi:hypothetical protein